MPTFLGVTTHFQSLASGIVFLPKPPLLAVGDGMVAHIAYKNVPVNISPPFGWTEHLETGLGYVATKVADAADVLAVTFQFTFAGITSRCASLMHFSGVEQTAGFVDNIAQIQQPAFGGTSPIFCPALVASRTARFIISAHSSSSSNRGQGVPIFTGPAGFTERADGTAFELALGVYTKDVEVLSIPSEAIVVSPVGNILQAGVAMAIVGPLPTAIDAVAVGSPNVTTFFIPFVPPPPVGPPPSPPAPVDDPASDCTFAGIQVGAPVPSVRDDCGVIPRVDDAVEFTGVQAGQAEPVEPVGGFFSLGRVRIRILNPNSVQ